MEFTNMDNKATRILKVIQGKIGGRGRVSLGGVPHLVVAENFSVCYFGSTRTLRIFTPYPSYGRRQKKYTFKTWVEVVNFFQAMWSDSININVKVDGDHENVK